eukprot:jgi/Botrbrau1/1729/Bobra.116_2s0071.1
MRSSLTFLGGYHLKECAWDGRGPDQRRCILSRRALPTEYVSHAARLQPRSFSSNRVCCHATTGRWELSTYKFPGERSAMMTWLEDCIQAAVKNLHRAPFLQLMSPDCVNRFTFHEVTPAVVHVPQLWRGIAEHVTSLDPEILVLVHPIPLDEEDKAEASIRRAGQQRGNMSRVLSGISSQPLAVREHHLRLQACAQLVQTGMAETQLAGRVGDCCDGDEVSQVVPFNRGHASHGAQQTFHVPGKGCPSNVRFWGVVIQAKSHPSELDGCYVLKTVHSGSADCHCTHYTLTRVCRGEPLAAQLAASWLVQPASQL